MKITAELSNLCHKLTACSVVDSGSRVKPNLPQKKCGRLVAKSVLYQATIILNIPTLTGYSNTLQSHASLRNSANVMREWCGW